MQKTVRSARSDNPAKNYSSLLTNLFPIKNAEELSCKYQLWKVSGLSVDNQEFEQNKVALRFKIRSDIKGPAEIIQEGDQLFVAIPEGYKEPESAYSLTPHVATLKHSGKNGKVDFASNTTSNRILAIRFLQSSLANELWLDNRLWQPKSGRPFYFKNPENKDDNLRQVDVFKGFAFRVIYVENEGYCILADSRTRYVSTQPWPKYIPFEDRWDFLRQSPDSDEESMSRNTHCVYHFGDQWYEVLVSAIMKENIAETLFIHPETNQHISVYDYTQEKWAEKIPHWCADIKEDYTAINYVTWKGGPTRHGIAHLCYPVVKVSDLAGMGLGNFHYKYSIKKPNLRHPEITKFISQYMQGAKLGDQTIFVENESLPIKRNTFFVPPLEFGNDEILDLSKAKFPFRHYPKTRLRTLQNGGFWDSKPLGDQWVLIPRSIENTIWPAFRENLAIEIEKFYEVDYQPNVIKYDDFEPGLYRQAVAISEALKGEGQGQKRPQGYCLTILSSGANSQLPAYLTSTYTTMEPPLHMACIHLDSFAPFYKLNSKQNEWQLINSNHPDFGKAKGYLRNVALKVLLLNRRWPFVFANHQSQQKKNLGETLFIGFDVLNEVAGFTFLGKGGRVCFFKTIGSEDREKISARKVYNIVSEGIKSLIEAYNWTPTRVVLVRDGRLFDEELTGFQRVLDELKFEKAAAVEIPKHTALGVRFFDKPAGKQTTLRNPPLGAWLKLSEDETVICTTGWPFTTQGTSMPLLVRKKWGTEDIVELGQNIFDLAQLAWTAPDRPARYPIVIRFTDMHLEAIATEFDKEVTEFGNDEDIGSQMEEDIE